MIPRAKPANILIRTMLLADLPEVEAIDQSVFSLPWPTGSFLYELRTNSNSIDLVAVDSERPLGRQIVGMVVVWMIADEAHVATLAILPEYRHQGIALRLMATALAKAQKEGMVKSLLEVRAGNTDALSLYFGLGYHTVGLRPGYYEDNHEDALLLTLEKLDSALLNKLSAEKSD